MRRASFLCFMPALVCMGAAHAGRPLNTDDAAILPEGGCQLETWLRPSAHLHQLNVQPACNFGGRIEWGASLVRERAAGSTSVTPWGLQAKTVFREATAADWGIGASLAFSRTGDGDKRSTLRTATLLATALPTQALTLHANLGATQATSQHALATWAAAIEYRMNPQWTLVAESGGTAHAHPVRQLGARTWLDTDHLQLDATIGREAIDGRAESFVTVGVVWFWDGGFGKR